MKLTDILQAPWSRRVVRVLLGVLASWALGWLIVPPLLKSQIEKLGSQALGVRGQDSFDCHRFCPSSPSAARPGGMASDKVNIPKESSSAPRLRSGVLRTSAH